MFKKLFSWTMLLFFYLFIIILYGEIYARVKHSHVMDLKAQIASYRRADFQFHHSFIPNSRGYSTSKEWNVAYDINSFGLRDRDYPVEKASNAFRILALGDSITEGHGVAIEHTFVKALERKLNEAFGDDGVTYEFINSGIGGYSPIMEYLFLSKRALLLKPDMVVLFYDFNDLKDDHDYEVTTVFDKDNLPLRCFPYKRIRAYSFHPIERFLIKYSRYYLYLENRINKKLFKLRHKGIRFGDEIPASIGFKGSDHIVQELWNRNEKYLGLIHEILKERKIPFVIVSYPWAVEVSPTEWSKGRLSLGFEVGKTYDQPQAVDFLRRFSDERGIPFINLYYDFKKSDVHPLYYDTDGHFNANGHALAAEALFPKLFKIILLSSKRGVI